MYISNSPFRTKKENPADEFSVGAKLLVRAGFVEKNFSGVYTYLPLGFRVLQKIAALIRKEMNAIGGQEILMPALTQKSVWDESHRWEVLSDIMYQVKDRQDRIFSLAPTHEDVLSAILAHHITGSEKFPICLYQIQDKFRDEPRAKSGLMRTREFLMKDLYSFHNSYEDFNRFYEVVKEAYVRIFKQCELKAYVTQASGGTFSKENSHEFMVESEAGEDKVLVCPMCGFAQNVEVAQGIRRGCSECNSDAMREIKAVEVGNIFKLGTKFSEAFHLTYLDAEGVRQPVVMGSYGIGLGRVMGTIADVSSDERGLVWPVLLAPYHVYLAPLYKGVEDTKIKGVAEKVCADLQASGVEVLYDDREKSPGEKFADADLLGIPLRIVISEKTFKDNSLEIKVRKTGEVKLVPIGGFLETVKSFLV